MAKLFLFYLIALSSLFMANLRLTTASRHLLSSDGFPDWVSSADRKLLQSPPTIRANLVVAQDGSGDYRTISEAVAASVNLRNGSTTRFVIHVKAGLYKEIVQITSSMTNLMMVGDGKNVTVVTGNKNVKDLGPRFSTIDTATFAVKGDGFIAQDMTFQNTAGRTKEQAVALMSQSNRSVFYRCSFEGYQDTLYVFSKVQFYRNCDVYGTIDFIFGDATAVFQECTICVRKPMDGSKNTITAQGRKNPATPSGITIQDSVVEAASELRPVQNSFPTYLGRPWQNYSRTVFMNTYLGSLINSAGWLEWENEDPSRLSTLYYGEYLNTGPGASTAGRVKWKGYHNLTRSDAENFTVGKFLSGDMWIPATGIPYKSGL